MDKINADIRGSLLLPVADTLEEIQRAEAIHGKIPDNVIRSVAILTEEVGEVAQAALELTRTSMSRTVRDRSEDMRQELIQVAATALRMVEALDGENV